MSYYVYILRSTIDGTLYKGSSADYIQRFHAHNSGLSRYTRGKTPWELIYVEVHESKTSALIREKKLKRCNRNYLLWLIEQPGNILKT